MPAARQNALIKQYCLVCHTDAVRNGGLTLEHFDAAQPHPADAAMIVSKLNTGALGAAGVPPPPRPVSDALVEALVRSSAGSNRWIIANRPGAGLTASIVQQLPPAAKGGQPNLYRLTLTCQAETRAGEMQIAWSPDVPENGRVASVVVDRQPKRTFKVEGFEKMGTGAGMSGPGAARLYSTAPDPKSPQLPLPESSLTIASLFGNESVTFSFDGLPPDARRDLANCVR